MKIIFSPILSDKTLTLHKDGEVLTVNGEEMDFSGLDEGYRITQENMPSDSLLEVRREDGELIATVMLPYTTETPSVAFPEDLDDVEDGNIELPEGANNG